MAAHDELIMVCQQFVAEQDEIMEKFHRASEKMKMNLKTINEIHKQQHNQIKQDLEALLIRTQPVQPQQNLEQEINKLDTQGEQLREELSEAKLNHQELSAQVAEIRATEEKLTDEKEKLLAEKERLDNETTILLPKRREEISLYSNVSGIRWDFDTSPDEAKGFISNKCGVKPFSFDKRKSSQFFIVNSLWDSMKEDW